MTWEIVPRGQGVPDHQLLHIIGVLHIYWYAAVWLEQVSAVSPRPPFYPADPVHLVRLGGGSVEGGEGVQDLIEVRGGGEMQMPARAGALWICVCVQGALQMWQGGQDTTLYVGKRAGRGGPHNPLPHTPAGRPCPEACPDNCSHVSQAPP